VENNKLKKLTGWLLYNAGAQPTEPKPGELHLVGEAKAETVPRQAVTAGWRAQLWRYRLPLSVAAGLLLLVGAWWTVGPFLNKAYLGDQKVSLGGSTVDLESHLNATLSTYKLPVQYQDGSTKQFTLSEVGFALNTNETIKELRAAQQSTAQRFMWWRPIRKPLALTSNPTKLHAFIANHITASVQPSQDATLTVENGNVTVTDAVTGKQYGLDNPQINLLNHIARIDRSPLKISLLTTNPAVTAQELAGSKVQLEKVLTQPISFTIDKKTITPSKKDIAGWLELTPDPKAKKVDVDINSGKVLEYINKIAASNVHASRDQIEVTRDDGTRSVIVPGVNGIDVTDKQTIATNVANSLLAGKGIQASLPVSFKPYDTISTAAYDKWIEVDLTNKRMYAYEKTAQVRTFLVSAGAPKTPTVTGKYSIYSKYTQKDMRGRNVDGSKYFQPNVPWVNFFYKDYAIHGNYWRPTSYFGNINSSHGCVSTVPSEAAWIYDWAPIGTPVIIHT
jgi:lipoprotein-anchoring transpeptidase ErfK/SrfK